MTMSKYSKPVVRVSVHTGKVLAEYPSIHAGARDVGRLCSNIRYAILYGKTAAGFRWRFRDADTVPEATHSRPRAVTQWEKTGERICEYDSMIEASKLTGASYVAICHSCRSHGARSAGGYLWTYSPETLPREYRRGGPRARRKSRQYVPGTPVVVTFSTGVEKRYESVGDACADLRIFCGTSRDAIYKCLNRVPHHLSAYGFRWRYAEEDRENA